MKNILKSTLLLMCGAFILASCADDNDSNPVLQKPTSFVLNTPALATNGTYDLANSTSVELTCTQPNYGFPITTNYTIEVATKADMSNATKMSTSFKTAKIDVDAAEMAAALTEQALKDGKTEADFPIDIPVYIRAKATPITAMGSEIDSLNHSYAIESNVITLKHVHLAFSLPPVNLPEHIYITGNFNNWSWDNPLDMVMVNGSNHVYWHLVYIDDSGIKFNTTKKWDGNEKGFAGITVNASSELGSEIKSHDGNIASSNPGWYLMIVDAKVEGRDIKYDVTFNKPQVYLIGTATSGDWTENQADQLFTVPTTKEGQFVSPAFAKNTTGDGGLRAYVKLPGTDWWKTEFMVFDKKIKYRGTGGDQERINATAGQKLYLNFCNETGEIK